VSNNLNLAINVSAIDNASSALRAVGNVVQNIASGNVAGAAIAVGAAVVGIGAASVKMAADFQSGITTLETGAGESKSNLQMVADGIKNLAISTGTSTKQLTDGMFAIESAGFRGADGLNVLKAAAEGAKAQNADLGTVGKAVSTILVDYHLKSSQAVDATNALITTVQSGNMHLQDLAGSMGAVLPIASQMGVSFPQVGAAIATMTNSGMGAQQAAQNLAHTMLSLSAPNSVATKSMAAVGIKAQQLKDTLANQGLPAAIQLIEDHVGKKFPAGSVQAVTAFKNIMGGATGYSTALKLGGANMAIFKGNVDSISGAMKAGGADIQNWSDVQSSFNFKMQQAQQAVNVLMINLGTALLPVLGQIVGAIPGIIDTFGRWKNAIDTTASVIGRIIKAIADWIEKHHPLQTAINLVKTAIKDGQDAIHGLQQAIQNVVTWFRTWGPLILGVASPIIVFFLPAIIKAGVEAVISGAKIAANFIKSMITTGYEATINGAKLSVNFVKSMIQSGYEAAIAGAKIAVNFVRQVIQSGVEAVIAGAKITGQFVAGLVRTGIEGWQAAGKLAMFIGSLIATGAQAVWAGIKMAASFVASLVTSGIQAAISAGIFLSTLVPSLLATAAAALAATWPFLLIAAVVAVVVIGVILAIQHWAQIMAWLQGVLQAFWGWIVGLGNGIVNIWNNLKSGVVGALQGLWNFINGFFGGLPGQALQWGINIIQGFINGIRNMLGAVGSAASSVVDTVKNFLGFHSPAKEGPGTELDLWPRNMVASYAKGLTAGVPQIQAAMNLLVKPLAIMGAPAQVGAGASAARPSTGGGPTINNYITVNALTRNKKDIEEVANLIEEHLSHKLRRSGNMTTWTSGGAT